jgi:predicted acyl esterase
MKRIFFLLFLFACFSGDAQSYLYKKDTAMIRMRDGVRLFTVIYTPVNLQGKFPFMIERTPYGADDGCDTCKTFDFFSYPAFSDMAKDGYIFVFQDIRGSLRVKARWR